MNNKLSSLPPLKTWQFWNACRNVLSDTTLTTIYRRGQRQIYRWAADPDFTSNHERNPLDRLKIVLERLNEIGREDLAVSALNILAHSIGYEVKKNGKHAPEPGSIDQQCLDVYSAITQFQKAIHDEQTTDEIRYLAREAKRRIEHIVATIEMGDMADEFENID